MQKLLRPLDVALREVYGKELFLLGQCDEIVPFLRTEGKWNRRRSFVWEAAGSLRTTGFARQVSIECFSRLVLDEADGPNCASRIELQEVDARLERSHVDARTSRPATCCDLAALEVMDGEEGGGEGRGELDLV